MKKLTGAVLDVLTSLIIPAVIFSAALSALFLFSEKWPFFNVFHFIGGASIAWMFLFIQGRWTNRGIIPSNLPAWLRDYIAFGSVAIFGILWEFMEFVLLVKYDIAWQATLTDTINDLFLDLMGGITLIVMYRLVLLLRKR